MRVNVEITTTKHWHRLDPVEFAAKYPDEFDTWVNDEGGHPDNQAGFLIASVYQFGEDSLRYWKWESDSSVTIEKCHEDD